MEALLLQEAARAEAAARLEQAKSSKVSISCVLAAACSIIQEARSPIDAWRARDAALASEKAAKDMKPISRA